MTAPKPEMKNVFDPSNVTATMSAVKQIAREKGVPSMTVPGGEQASEAAGDSVVPLKKVRKVTPAPTSKGTMELPQYLWEELALKGVKQKVTKRYLVLQAFKDAGYSVHDIDLYKDGRRAS